MSSFTQSQTVNGREEIAFACSDFSLQVFQSPDCFSSSQVFFVFWLSLLLIQRVVTSALGQNRVHPQVRGHSFSVVIVPTATCPRKQNMSMSLMVRD